MKDEGRTKDELINELLKLRQRIAELEKAEKMYSTLIERGNDGIVIIQDGLLKFANLKMSEITGFSVEEGIERPFIDFVSPPFRKFIIDNYNKRMSGERVQNRHEIEIVSKDGKKIPVEINASLIEYNGRPAVMAIIRDITERKKAEEEQNLLQQRLEALWKIASLVDADFQTLCNHVMTEAITMTQSRYAFYGFLNEDESVMTIYSWSKEVLEDCQVQDKPIGYPIAKAGIWGDAVRERRILIINDYRADHPSKKGLPKGHIQLERIMVVPIFSRSRIVALVAVANKPTDYTEEDAKQVDAFVASVQTILERRQAEEELERSLSILRATLESTIDGILVVDEEGKILNFNKKFLDMWRIPEYIIKSQDNDRVLAFISDQLKDPEEFLKDVRELHSQPDAEIEDFIEFKDGRIFRRYSQPMRVGGKSIGRVWSFRDVTERKRMEKSLIQLNEVLRMINKILRHDILNDLTIVGGSLEVYRENKDERLLNNALHAVERGVELIKRMRELESLVSSGETLKPYCIREVVENVVRDCIENVTKDCSLEFNIEGDCIVLADEALSSVIENIIRNAIVHSGTERVDIKIERKGDLCEIRIADYGVGVPDEIKEGIFEEGFSYGEYGGSGLGLYIVKKTIERYGGSIHIEDNKPNGAVFILTLKVASDYSGIRTSLRIPVLGHAMSTPSTIFLDKKVKGSIENKTVVEGGRSMNEEIELDLKGLKCPQPILKLHSKVVKLAEGTILKVVADCPTFERDLKLWASKTRKTILECVKNGNIWRARIRV